MQRNQVSLFHSHQNTRRFLEADLQLLRQQGDVRGMTFEQNNFDEKIQVNGENRLQHDRSQLHEGPASFAPGESAPQVVTITPPMLSPESS